jgi:GR25 family glycosyltransferase involved in LPS biosynthesis
MVNLLERDRNDVSFITNAFVISMYHNKERWAVYQDLPDNRIKRYCGVDTRTHFKAGKRLAESGYTLDLIGENEVLYFSQGPGAVGCFLAHVELWRRIVQKEMEWTLIIEDDALVSDISTVLSIDPKTHPGIFGDYYNHDIIQLNRRTPTATEFHGTESYILSLAGAKKLLDWCNQHKSIRTAVDRHIGMMIHCSTPEEFRLKCTIRPRVRLAPSESDIMSGGKSFWSMNQDELDAFRMTSNYKWWD